MSKKGFTLAEVLITLAIIGVVAAMTIPSVIVRTNQQEFRTGAKKAFSVLNNAIQLVETQDNLTFNDSEFNDALAKRLNIVKFIEEPYDFYTADGFAYIGYGGGVFIVDVNGDKGPTTAINIDGLSDAAEAKYNSEDDLLNPEWPNVKLTDIFIVAFNSETGSSRVIPFSRAVLNDDCILFDRCSGGGGPV